MFGVTANAIKMRRQVQVYRPDGDAKPPDPLYSTAEFAANRVTVGAFTLSKPFIEQIDRFRPMRLEREVLSRLPPDLRWDAHREPHGFFIGENPKTPRFGEIRVIFQAVGPLVVSVVGRQEGNLLVPFPTDKGVIALLREGAHSVDGMFPQARYRGAALIWGGRMGGFALMFAGLSLILIPLLKRRASVDPFFNGVAERADPRILAFLMASALSFATIAAVWFVVRPVLAAVLIGTAAAFIFGLWMLPERTSE